MCTSGIINSRAFSGRARPQGPGDEDEEKLDIETFNLNIFNLLDDKKIRLYSPNCIIYEFIPLENIYFI